MSVYNESQTTRTAQYGVSVSGVAKNLPATTAGAIFNVAGGRVAITQIIGEVTTAIQNQANNAKLQFVPTGGTAIDLCDVLNIANDAVGTLYSIDGTPNVAMKNISKLADCVTPSTLQQTKQIPIGIGAINLNCSATNTGKIKWTTYYIAMDDGSYIEAA